MSTNIDECDVKVDPEFASLIPPLRSEEFGQLQENILRDGIRDPLSVWSDHGILLDGHNRLKIATEHGIEYRIVEIDLPDRDAAADWIDANQLGRRNLTADAWTLLLGRRYNRAKKAIGGRSDRDLSGDQSEHPKTSEHLAGQYGVGQATVRRAGKFADAVDAVKEIDPEIERHVVSGKAPPRAAVVMAAKILEDSPDKAAEVLKPDGKSIKKIRKEIDAERRAEAKSAIPEDMPGVTDRYKLICRSVDDCFDDIDKDSADWVITDPPYPEEFLPLYSSLGSFASRILKPGGSLVCMVGQSYLPEIVDRLSDHLTYNWTLALLTPGGQSAQLWDRKVNCFWKPLLWFIKDEYKGDWIGDVCRSDVNDNDKDHHHWGQSESGMADIIERFTYPGQTICDPFCGGGTTGVVAVRMNRLFIGIDKDPEAIKTTAQRLSEACNG